MIRVVVVARSLAIRTGLRALLSNRPIGEIKPSSAVPLAQNRIEIIGEAANLDNLVALPPDTDVLLITSEVLSITELTRLIDLSENRPAVLLLSDEAQDAQELSSLTLRAWGILPVDASPEELQVATGALHEGLLVGAPALMSPLFDRLSTSFRATGRDFLIEPLTERESQVLQQLAQGLPNKQIAASLGISEHTVKFHISAIYSKLGATNRTEAVRLGIQHGLVLL